MLVHIIAESATYATEVASMLSTSPCNYVHIDVAVLSHLLPDEKILDREIVQSHKNYDAAVALLEENTKFEFVGSSVDFTPPSDALIVYVGKGGNSSTSRLRRIDAKYKFWAAPDYTLSSGFTNIIGDEKIETLKDAIMVFMYPEDTLIYTGFVKHHENADDEVLMAEDFISADTLEQFLDERVDKEMYPLTWKNMLTHCFSDLSNSMFPHTIGVGRYLQSQDVERAALIVVTWKYGYRNQGFSMFNGTYSVELASEPDDYGSIPDSFQMFTEFKPTDFVNFLNHSNCVPFNVADWLENNSHSDIMLFNDHKYVEIEAFDEVWYLVCTVSGLSDEQFLQYLKETTYFNLEDIHGVSMGEDGHYLYF
jgi:hypothetical protein